MDYKQSAVEVVAQKATYGAAGGAFVLGLTANEAAALGGLAVAFLAMLVNAGINFYFKKKHLELAREKAKSSPFPSLIGDEE